MQRWCRSASIASLKFVNQRLAYLALSATVAVGALTLARPAHACSCMRPPDPATARDGSDAVFEGVVTGREAVEGDQLPGMVEFTFEVKRRWKGDAAPGDSVTLRTADNSAACGREFEQGKAYLIYASTMDGQLGDNLCSRTMDADQASEQGDFEALGPDLDSDAPAVPPAEAEEPRVDPPAGGEAPKPTDADQKAKSGCAVATDGTSGTGLAGLAALFGLALVSRRRRRD